MQLTFSFPTLLASLLVALALVNDASAVPVKRTNGMVTLPIKRVAQRGDIHPQVVRVFSPSCPPSFPPYFQPCMFFGVRARPTSNDRSER